MKTEFTPIAMRFNKENWESIKDRIEAAGIGHSVWAIDTYYYLCNNWDDDNSLFIGNHSAKHSNFKLVSKVYETWDEATFLKACGIEVDTTPTLEEVKKYFKNAKEVRCLWDGKIYNISSWNLYKDSSGFRYAENEKAENERFCGVFGISDYAKFAEIISYKDTYTVSKDFILEAHESACSTWKNKIENQFPELFPKVLLELNKWYKRSGELLVWNGGKNTYGFCQDGGYCHDMLFSIATSAIPATKEEVETALIAEAKKKYTLGCKIKKLDNFYYGSSNLIIYDLTKIEYEEDINQLSIKDKEGYWICVFDNGKWAEIISEPIELSLEQIAEKFGVDVSQIKIKK